MDDYKIIVEQEHSTVMAHYDIPKKDAEGYQSEAKLEAAFIKQQRIVSILDTFEASIQNLEAQLKEREKQYEYYRNKLLSFN